MKKIFLSLLALACFFPLLDKVAFDTPWAPPPHLETLSKLDMQVDQKSGVALLVNGGFGIGKNHRRYWNNLSLMYFALKKQGWRKIIVLDADGLKGAPDQEERSYLGMFSTGTRVDSAFDLDGNGTDDVHGAATIQNFTTALETVKKELLPGEDIFLFLTDHGQLRWNSGLDSVALFWHQEFTSKDFASTINILPKDHKLTILAAQCHSSLFLKHVSRPNTELIASGYPLWIWSTQDYSVFPYHFAAALLGVDPTTGQALHSRDKGITDFKKAFEYARRHDHAPEWPVRREIPMDPISNSISLGY